MGTQIEVEPAFTDGTTVKALNEHRIEHNGEATPTLRLNLESNGFSNKKALAEESKPPPSLWIPHCHPRAEEVARIVDDYYLQNWPFPTQKSKIKFLNAGFSRPRLPPSLTVASADHHKTQDQLEHMSLAEGKAFNDGLMPIMSGSVQPDLAIPAEYITYDLWNSMRAVDETLANTVLEPTFVFMRAQTDKARLDMKGFARLLSALMRFSLDLHLSPSELRWMDRLERYCARHISAVNDIMSWEKELKASQSIHHEGSVLCTAVKVVMDETGVDVAAAKKMLWVVTREWEGVFEDLVKERLEAGCGQAVRYYMQGLEHQMSGNELWSSTTLRYNNLGVNV
ncbi:MAG: hypothetical protein Q9201_005771 [Fulgogasparrea decipioides]